MTSLTDQTLAFSLQCLHRAAREARASVQYALQVDATAKQQALAAADDFDDLAQILIDGQRKLGAVQTTTLARAVAIATIDEDVMSLSEMEQRRAARIAECIEQTSNEEQHIKDALVAVVDRLQGKQLILDMDDTLISNSLHFAHSETTLIELMAQANPALTTDQITAQLHVVDHALLPTYGYTPRRWYETARSLATWVADGRDNVLERQALEAADLALEVGRPLPGVIATLETLHGAGIPMAIKTKGDLAKQTEKLEAHRFDRFVGDNIVIVDRKNQDTFRSVVKKFGFTNAVSIGDSGPSDITPALMAGLGAVHLVAPGRARSAPESGGHTLQAPTTETLDQAIVLLAQS